MTGRILRLPRAWGLQLAIHLTRTPLHLPQLAGGKKHPKPLLHTSL